MPGAEAAVYQYGEANPDPCPVCGGVLLYRGGNWNCNGTRDYVGCGWSTVRHKKGGDRTTLEHCPRCGATVVYNGNYFCEHWGTACDWAMPHPPVKQADRELSLRLTGDDRT